MDNPKKINAKILLLINSSASNIDPNNIKIIFFLIIIIKTAV